MFHSTLHWRVIKKKKTPKKKGRIPAIYTAILDLPVVVEDWAEKIQKALPHSSSGHPPWQASPLAEALLVQLRAFDARVPISNPTTRNPNPQTKPIFGT